jgi:hypothetical protein
MSMNSSDLRDVIDALGLTQTEFGRLVDVSPGAVAQWLSGARGIPGPVDRFVSLLFRLPPSVKDAEINRIKDRSMNMKNGMYAVYFQGTHGEGAASLTFKDGVIFGFDVAGAEYDGFYKPLGLLGGIEVTVNVKMKAHEQTVAGGLSYPFDWNMVVTTNMNPFVPEGDLIVKTNVGPEIKARYVFMRDLPLAA